MESEFNILIRRMEKNLEMRHTYLMFAFTTTIATIAFLFVENGNDLNYWVCIAPFAVIIPFQARISYSRFTHARMEAYIKVYYSKEFRYAKIPIEELKGIMGGVIKIISNYELSILAVVIDIFYFLIKNNTTGTIGYLDIDFNLMIILTGLVILLATYAYPYGTFLRKFEKEYRMVKVFKKMRKKGKKSDNM